MATNDFLQFATAGGANVESQAAYSSDTLRTNGNQPGVAVSALNNKAIRQAAYVASNVAQMMSDFTGASVLDDTVTAEFLSILKAAVQALPPVITNYTSGSGNHNVSYYFFVASANATTAATYTNNGVTYTVAATISAGTLLRATGDGAPTISGTLTKASGTGDATITFYAVRAPLMLVAEIVGGGGGGGGAIGSPTDGGAGGNTTFGTTLLVASGGGAGHANGTVSSGGGANLNGVTGISVIGSDGSSGPFDAGSSGGSSYYGGSGGGGTTTGVGDAAKTNSGSGGGGAGSSSGSTGAGGGASGGWLRGYIPSPASTYPFAVGAAGTAGTGTAAGGAGGAGHILVIENFQ